MAARTSFADSGVYNSMEKKCLGPLLAVALLAMVASRRLDAQLRYPWVYPGDFRDRIKQADLIVSGTIRSTVATNIRLIDGVRLRGNRATITVDRVFKGHADDRELRFVWFSPAPVGGQGFAYSGPPLAKFLLNQRFMVFLRQNAHDYVVSMPLYQMEVPLATASQAQELDVPMFPETIRDSEMAQELERAALSIGPPAPGTTGLAATYFPHVVALVGGCAKPFLEHFAASPSRELREDAERWLTLARKDTRCGVARH